MRQRWMVLTLLALSGCSMLFAPDPAERPAIPPRAHDASPWMIARDSVR